MGRILVFRPGLRPLRRAWAGLLVGTAVAAGVAGCAGASPSVPATPVAAVAGGVTGGGTGTPTPAATGSAPSDVTTRRAVNRHGALVVRKSPSAAAAVLVRLPATTALGSPRVLLVEQVRSGWVQVDLPTRPNGRRGWVASSAVRLETGHDQVTVDLATRRMTIVLDGRQVSDTAVGIGSTANPTPTGRFYVTDRVRPSDPSGAYGAFALGLSAHSTTLSEFGNGDGQVGIHGTDVPGSIGKAVSHGCIRVPDDVTAVLARVPLGTPVVIG